MCETLSPCSSCSLHSILLLPIGSVCWFSLLFHSGKARAAGWGGKVAQASLIHPTISSGEPEVVVFAPLVKLWSACDSCLALVGHG